jgi:hypothetical protein
MKSFAIIFILLNIVFLKAEIIDELRFAADARNGETLILFHYNILRCVKCDIEPNDILFNMKKNPSLKSIKIMATVICDRDIELKIFAKDNLWKYAMFRNDGTLLSKLNASKYVFITVIKPNNNILHLKPGKPEANYSKIIDFIN